MQVLQGIAVSAGIAIGEALVIDNEGLVISRRTIEREAIDAELARLDCAIESVSREIDRDREAISEQLGRQYGAIFSAHRQMLEDPHLHGELEQLIHDLVSPEMAVHTTLRGYARVFQEMRNTYLAERAHDLHDLEERLLDQLLGRRPQGPVELSAPTIVLGPRSDTQRNVPAGSQVGAGIRHRSGRRGRTHGDFGQRPGTAGRGRHRSVTARGGQWRPDHCRR